MILCAKCKISDFNRLGRKNMVFKHVIKHNYHILPLHILSFHEIYQFLILHHDSLNIEAKDITFKHNEIQT